MLHVVSANLTVVEVNRQHDLVHKAAFHMRSDRKETMHSAVEQFLSKFLTAPTGKSPNDLAGKVAHWVSVCNDPQQFYSNADAFELRYRRRNARQNIRRVLSKHPELVATVTRVMQEHEVRQ